MVLRNDIGVMVSSNIDAYRIHLRKRKESEIYMKLIKQIPSEDGFYMPGEFEPHKGCILIWPKRPGSWGYEAKAAGNAFAAVIKAIAQSEKVYVAVTKKTLPIAQEKLFGENKNADIMQQDNIELFFADTDDAWARDVAPTFVKLNEHNTANSNQEGSDQSSSSAIDSVIRAINWEFNAWGGNVDGLYASWEKDNAFASAFADQFGFDWYDAAPFVLEGGSIHSDGEGTLLTTESCLLSAGRNPNLSREQIEEQLSRFLGIKKVLWLPRGIYQDETNEHVDNVCAFLRPGEVVLAWTDNKDDPQYELSHQSLSYLENVRDAKGRKLVIHKLPIPDHPICITKEDLDGYTFEEGEDMREVGERLAASYVNFYFSNDAIILPVFGGENKESDERAVQLMQQWNPDRKVIPVFARDILTGGGNIHCITQQIPR